MGVDADALVEMAATLLALCFCSAPGIQVYRVLKTPGRVAEVNAFSLLVQYCNCVLWIIYGVFLPMPPALPANLYGGATSVAFLCVCWYHARIVRAPQWNAKVAYYTIYVFVASVA